MSLKCIFGMHKWNGCKCSACGKTRDELHDWSNNCEKCARCGKQRTDAHKWDGCKCSACGKARDEGHDWGKNCHKCARCGKQRTDAHKWDGCKCSACGTTRDEDHHWSTNCQMCAKCGKVRANVHAWNGCKCSVCGNTRDGDEGHTWHGCRCTACGTTRDKDHSWDGCKCAACAKTRDERHKWSKKSRTCVRCGAAQYQPSPERSDAQKTARGTAMRTRVDFIDFIKSNIAYAGHQRRAYEDALSGLPGSTVADKMDQLIDMQYLAPFTYGSTTTLDAERRLLAGDARIASGIQECIDLATRVVDDCCNFPASIYMLRATAKLRSARSSLDGNMIASALADFEQAISSGTLNHGEADYCRGAVEFLDILRNCRDML